jgi:predicted lipoprotein with Yx(FWY)xxD motif
LVRRAQNDDTAPGDETGDGFASRWAATTADIEVWL